MVGWRRVEKQWINTSSHQTEVNEVPFVMRAPPEETFTDLLTSDSNDLRSASPERCAQTIQHPFTHTGSGLLTEAAPAF